MKASVIYTKTASEKTQEAVKKINDWIESSGYLWTCNWYAQKEVSAEADRFILEAVSKLDNSMKGWKPVAEGKETLYQIHHTLNGIEYSYTRYYTK